MKSKWITATESDSPIILKSFKCNKENKKILIRICGLGFFEAFLNGKRISEDKYVPAWSDYEPRDNRRILYPINDTFTHRVYYLEYDISEITEEDNLLEVHLGNGWYNQRDRVVEGDFWYGHPKLWFEIFKDHEMFACSEGNEKWRKSDILRNNIFSGEAHDFRLKKNTELKNVEICEAPKGELCRQECPADRIIKVITPKIIHTEGDKVLYDAGENVSGYAIFEQKGKPGDKTTVKYSENLQWEDKTKINSQEFKPEQVDEFISDGSCNVCEVKFAWHGFRYFEIQGNAENVEVYVVYADVKVKSSFESDNELLNKLYECYLRTQLTNMHCGVPSDCPHRERLGYTGDGQITADVSMLTLSMEEFHKKWIRDILDCQDVNNGHVQHTAPFYGGGGGPGGWGCAVVVVPYFHYKHYGDLAVLKEAYPHMVKWTEYMKNHSENGLVVREEDEGWCLGEWCTPGKVALPESFVNTYYFAKSLIYMNEIAELLEIDKGENEKLLEECKKALADNFYDEEENAFCASVQGADAFMIDLGLGNEEMLKRLAQSYDELGSFDTGIFGTDILLRVLFDNGYPEVACKLLTATGKNTYGYLLKGETTLWECWHGGSHNHPMFGSVVKYLFYNILGITFDEGNLKIKPYLPKCLNYAKGTLETRFGNAEVLVERKDRKIHIKADLSTEGMLEYGDEAGCGKQFDVIY